MSVTRTFGAFPTGKMPEDKIFNVTLPSLPAEFKLATPPSVMNQGTKPICAAMSIAGMMGWQEMAKQGGTSCKIPEPLSIYQLREDKKMDGMVPRDALCRVKEFGVDGRHINGYYFVDTIDLAKASIMTNGPMMLCTLAYDNTYFWRPSGNTVGGHATILIGWDREGFILQNSWGVEYANGGRIKFPFEDWRYALEGWTIEI